jgi:hypothetical protein
MSSMPKRESCKSSSGRRAMLKPSRASPGKTSPASHTHTHHHTHTPSHTHTHTHTAFCGDCCAGAL